MPRSFARALVLLLAVAAPAAAVDLSGHWFMCEDCRVGGVCDPLSFPIPGTDNWVITQSGTSLTIQSAAFSSTPFVGTIDPPSGAFEIPNPPNFIEFLGVGTFSAIEGTYDSRLQTGHFWAGRRCNLASPACDDGDPCTIDTCETTVVGTCVDSPVAVCVNTQSGACATTTTTSSTTSTTTSSLPLGHHPLTGSKLVLKRNSKGRETLTFVTKDPSVFVPTFGGPDDPTLVTTQIDVYSPNETSNSSDITIPPGTGNPGWLTKPTPSATYLFKNSSAPAGISKVRMVKLRDGKGLKIVARATGLSMTAPLGAAGIAIRFDDGYNGLPVLCAHFGAGSVRKDVPPVFIARTSPAPENCHPSTLRAP